LLNLLWFEVFENNSEYYQPLDLLVNFFIRSKFAPLCRKV